MRGYKGMTKHMTCHGMQFEVGKTNHVDGKLRLCENGLHYCKDLIDVFDYYSRADGNRFFEVEALGESITDGKKSVANSITILRELSQIEINRYVYGSGHGSGHGNGYGNDKGNGHGDDYGNISGNGFGAGYGNGDECGYGNGHISGHGYLSGNGRGDGAKSQDGNGFGDGFFYSYDGDNCFGSNIQKILVFNN